MKFATLPNGTLDGKLILVSRFYFKGGVSFVMFLFW